MNIGSTIKRRRERADLTRMQLAEMAGMKRTRILALETSNSSPTLRTLERVAKALKTSVWVLVKEAENG